jgi:hypothetical protein
MPKGWQIFDTHSLSRSLSLLTCARALSVSCSLYDHARALYYDLRIWRILTWMPCHRWYLRMPSGISTCDVRWRTSHLLCLLPPEQMSLTAHQTYMYVVLCHRAALESPSDGAEPRIKEECWPYSCDPCKICGDSTAAE